MSADIKPVNKTTFRNYTDIEKAVKEHYHKMRIHHTLDLNKEIRNFMNQREPVKMNIWDVFDKLNHFIDVSDPDINLPNLHHLLQTAEGIREDGHPEWLQVVGLIHDLGKILYYLVDKDSWGMSIKEQWGIAGDTFVLGCNIPNSIVYPEFNCENPDYGRYSENGIYSKQCGMHNLIYSYGHDEYLYQVLKDNKCPLPEEGYAIIRFHSCYLWHTEKEYMHFMKDSDSNLLEWVKIFNKYDLYTKRDESLDLDNLKEYYDKLIKKYLSPDGVLRW